VRKATDRSVLSASECDALTSVLASAIYLLEQVRPSGFSTRIAIVLNMIAELCAGQLRRAKPLPKSDQFLPASLLFRGPARGKAAVAEKIERTADQPDTQI
jgi:hypothetical protein